MFLAVWVNMKRSNQDMWVWVVSDETTKIVPVIQVGGRTQEMVYQVVHDLKGRLRPGRTAGPQIIILQSISRFLVVRHA